MDNTDKILAEIKVWQKEQLTLIDEKFPEFNDEYCAITNELQAKVDGLKLAALTAWTESSDYAEFKASQAEKRLAVWRS